MRKIFLIALLLSFTILQAQYLKPYFNTISVENGLPEGYVMSSLQDRLGYMWLGTQNGLMRYDGYGLKSYPIPDKNGVPLIYCSVRELHEDKEGKLWAYIRKNGLYLLNRQKDVFEKVKQEEGDADIFKELYLVEWVEEQKSDVHWLLAMEDIETSPCLFAYDELQNTFEKYSHDSKAENYIPMYETADIVQDAEGKIWLAADSLLSFFDNESRSFIPWFVIPDSTKDILISSITIDPTNKDMIWITTLIPGLDERNIPSDRALYQLNTKTKAYRLYEHSEEDTTSIAGNCDNIISDSLNRLWFCTDNGISLFNPLSGSFTNYAIDLQASSTANPGNIQVIASDKEENLWIAGTFNGLFHLDVKTAKLTFHTHSSDPGSLPDSPRGINKVFYDRSGTFWVSLPWRGIAYLDHQKSIFNPIPIELPSSETHGISQDDYHVSGKHGDSIFFVNNTSGLFAWNYKLNNYTRIDLNNDDAYNQVRTVIVGSDGTLWIGCGGAGLFSYNPKNKSVENFTHDPNDSTSISSNQLNSLVEDRDGILWIGTNDRGLCSFDKKSSKFKRFPYIINNGLIQAKNELDDNRVLFMSFDREGILWIGTNQGALNSFDTKTETFISYLDQKIGFSCVVNIYEDSKWRLWAGTYLSGLYVADKATLNKKRYSEQDGLIFNSTFGITEDNEGNIWTASSRGLSKLDPENNIIHNFHFPIGSLRYNDILFRESDGTIQLAKANGIISFNPDKINASIAPPSTVIEKLGYTNASNRDTSIYVNGKDLIELKHIENKIKFQYVALHFANSELNQYAYKLEGYDKDWIEAGTQRSATYTNLSPGKYTFYVKAGSSDGVWNEKAASFSVIILPPWWKTWWAYGVYGLILIAIVLVIDRIQRRRLVEKANREAKEKELKQAKEIEKAYTTLKATQDQLLHSEKMASLGELTAGIAHEIQNPLNFVNNFSEVNTELIAELKEEIEKGELEEVKSIANDIERNEKKIAHHGRRADGIVKGMLLHSRSGGGNKEPSNVNILADEYLRLSYHGLRAKDKSFNAEFTTDFDKSIPLLNIIPQDVGRVILNLINNAFHAVAEKNASGIDGYKPKVSVATKLEEDHVTISVKDNGNGIPKDILDKIYQPFFTTKSAGEGTGLGLSLSYDIISKGHGGKLIVETEVGLGTEFIIKLPK